MEWSELAVGQELELVKPPIDKIQLVKYAGASGDFNLIHTDDETAREAGFPGVIAHGMLVMGFLGQFLSGLLDGRGFVSRLHARFQGVVLPGSPVTCRATVAAKDEERRTVDLTVSAETSPGRPSVLGSATITYAGRP